MSFNRVEALPDYACVDVIIDGHEDWDSATDVIVEMIELAEARGWSRILIDFTRVNLRVALVEAPEIAKFFDSFVNHPMTLAIVLPVADTDRVIIGAFASALHDLGHAVSVLHSDADRMAWLTGAEPRRANG